jgi:hypothetical protein
MTGVQQWHSHTYHTISSFTSCICISTVLQWEPEQAEKSTPSVPEIRKWNSIYQHKISDCNESFHLENNVAYETNYSKSKYSRFVSKTVLRNKCSRCFYLYSLSHHVSAYLMAILKRIVQIIQRSCYSYNGSVVFSTIICVSCRQL